MFFVYEDFNSAYKVKTAIYIQVQIFLIFLFYLKLSFTRMLSQTKTLSIILTTCRSVSMLLFFHSLINIFI